jgi:sulfoquinovose isomerase
MLRTIPDSGRKGAMIDLDGEFRRLLAFGARVVHPEGGAAWLDDKGVPQLDQPVHTYITARMAHVYGLASLAGIEGAGHLADAMLDAMAGPLYDVEYGGWVASRGPGSAISEAKEAYTHAFVLLSASTATIVGRAAGPSLLERALTIHDRFWEKGFGMVADLYDRTWTNCDDYRGLNANMHTVEALLAAADATDDPQWLDRAMRIATMAVHHGRAFSWRLPEHYSRTWEPLLEYHRDRPGDPFKPYGATVGHGLEWSRLLLQLEAALGAAAPSWIRAASVALYDRSIGDGWAVDGAEGFIYTTDWVGKPVVHDRLHWVVTEAIGAAAALYKVTGDVRYSDDEARFWAYADRFMDRERGSWIHQLDRHNNPASSVWTGKPDLYHAVQATLIPRLSLAPSLAVSVRDTLA